MSEVSRSATTGSSTIVDAPKVIGILFFVIICLGVGCICLVDGYTIAGFVFIGFAALGIIGFIVNAKGYVIDVENDTFTFPGGGIEAESWLSYFNPMYWLQGLKRHSVPLSQIRHIIAYQDTNTSVSTDSRGNVRTRKTTEKIVEIDGDFGAIKFSFSSKGKMGQLYAAIVQINEMGSPMLRR